MKQHLEIVEQQRVKFQDNFDSKKTSEQRNKLGQYATPNKFAREILSETTKYFKKNQEISFIDPALGSGSFFTAYLSEFSDYLADSNLGVELDSELAEYADQNLQQFGLKVINQDFTTLQPNINLKFDLLVSNPPYSRHHHIKPALKERISSWAKTKYGLKVSKLSGLHIYFVLLAHQFIKENGIAVWLIPSEFLNVNFGTALKQFFLNEVEVLQIHKFSIEDLKFNDALVSSLVIWYRNSKPLSSNKIKFTTGSDIGNPSFVKNIEIQDISPRQKWSNYFKDKSYRSVKGRSISINDLFYIKRGIATGNNKYFILSEEDIRRKNLPIEYFRPILPPPKEIQDVVIKSNEIGIPLLDNNLFVLDTKKSIEELKKDNIFLYNYLQEGIDLKVNEGYLCKNRTPWYSQEQRDAPRILCNYIGRKNKTAPFRFILNWSNAITTNSFLGLYPKPILRRIGIDLEEVARQLNTIPTEELISKGRSYGGGMFKLEPRELADVELIVENEIFEEIEISEQLTLFEPEENYAS